jgi:uncharacterized protein (TIGR00369 family)
MQNTLLLTIRCDIRRTCLFARGDNCPRLPSPLTRLIRTASLTLSNPETVHMNKDHIDKHLQPMAHFVERGVPFNKHLGIQVELLTPGHCILRVPFEDTWIGDPTRPALHGGVVASLVDACSGAVTFTKLENVADRISTVDLRIDYLQPAPPADLYAESKIIRMGNRVAVCRTDVFSGGCPSLDGNDADPVATGHAVFNVLRRET